MDEEMRREFTEALEAFGEDLRERLGLDSDWQLEEHEEFHGLGFQFTFGDQTFQMTLSHFTGFEAEDED